MEDKNVSIPLAEKMRPKKLDNLLGQEKIIGNDSFLKQAIRSGKLPSLIFWGPPGSGKTTLARIIATETEANFHHLSAVSAKKKDLFEIIEGAKENKKKNKETILFLDEIHRWNKAQQDALLPFVENGTLILIGATTENPSFEVNAALISRVRVVVFEKLSEEAIEKIIKRTLKEIKKEENILPEAISLIASFSNGDARIALNILEICLEQNKTIDSLEVKKILQKSHLFYDKNGEEHYNIISALHKSMRGDDADAALYWLARMLVGGEDPIYVARRLVRFAAEDVGLANSSALLLANAVFDSCHKLGMPECEVHLAQCVIYLAKSKKSIAAYEAYEKAKKDVYNLGNLEIPLYLRNAPTKLMENIGYGKGYKYSPKEDSSSQEYFPEKLRERKYLEK